MLAGSRPGRKAPVTATCPFGVPNSSVWTVGGERPHQKEGSGPRRHNPQGLVHPSITEEMEKTTERP